MCNRDFPIIYIQHSPSRSRDSTPKRTGRPSKRYQPLPPVDIKQTGSAKTVVPYKNLDKIRSVLSSSPAPTSLLSSRINSYLRGSSLPLHPARDSISSLTSLLPATSTHKHIISDISYRPFLPDPSSPSVYSSQLSQPSRNQSSSPFLPRLKLTTYNSDDLASHDDDDDDDEPETSYRRKYKIVRSPAGASYGSGVRRIGEPALTYPHLTSTESDDVEGDYEDSTEAYGTYSCTRPSGSSSLKLSSYEGDYDGSYEADMAEMYDYVPFGPSRHGILELSEYENANSPSSYLTPVSVRSLSPPLSASSLSVVPQHSRYLEDAVSKPYQSSALLDSVVSNTVARAKKVLEDSKLPDYKQASLLLSVEGSAVSPDGKNRYGFRYYPPPIPLKGSHIGLDERILSITPKSVSPADSFLSNYLNKLRDIRHEVRDHVDRGEYGRVRSLAPAGSRPTYIHSTVHMPVHIEGRAHSVPVSSYRSRLHDGQSHRVDVFPLVVGETSLPSDSKLHLPYYKAGGVGVVGGERPGCESPNKLTVLEKINIKVTGLFLFLSSLT